MSFVEWYLRRPHLLLSVLLLGVALGILSFKKLPLNFFPDASYPKVVVILQVPGKSAEEIEKEVALPVEKELSTLSLVRKVRSLSRDGVAVVSVEFEYKKSLSSAEVDVSSALDRIKGLLPEGMLPPRIFTVSDATNPVMTIMVAPTKGLNLSLVQVRRIAEEYIKPEFLKCKEIGNVEVFGGFIPQVLIKLDRDALERYGLSFSEVAKAISKENKNFPAGVIRTNEKEESIKIEGEVAYPEFLKRVSIPLKRGGSISLGDIAEIKLTHGDRKSLFRGDGEPAIALNILRPEKGNVIAAINAAKEVLKKVKALYPQLRFKIVDTQETLIKTSVSNLIGALRDAILLTVAVIFLFLARVRATLLTAISIPITYFLTFFFMKLFSMELNIVTMTAIILAVGLLVDDSIVVAENIERHLREHALSPKQAAISGTKEIMLADLSGTITTVVVLLPIMFVGGYVEKILRPLAMVLVFALCSSYFVSITVIPLLAPFVLKKNISKYEKKLFSLSEFWLDFMRNFYVGLFRFGVKAWWFMIAIGVALLLLSIKFIFPLVGRDLMPPMDTGIVKVSFEIYPNEPVEKAEKVVALIEKHIKEIPGVKSMETVMGSEPDVISFGADRTPTQGVITFHLVDRFHRKKSIWEIEDALYKKLVKIPDLKSVQVFEYGATPISTISAPVDIMLSGENPDLLHGLALEVEKRLYHVPGIVSLSHSWDFDREEFLIQPDFTKLSLYGLNPEVVAKELQSAFSGAIVSLWHVPEERPYQIVIRLPESQRDSLEKALEMCIFTKKGCIPLRDLVEIKKVFTRPFIVRQDLSPVIDVLGYRRKAAISHIEAGIEKALKGLPLPGNVSLSQEGEIKPMKESFARLKEALIISLILLYFSLVPTFKSFRHPITIMIAIPLGLIGAFWGLLVMGKHFCMPAFMGMILLSGVVVNNSILLIDFIERKRAQGKSVLKAIEEAIRARTRPILMTAISTIVGMIPIAGEYAIGLERLSPLAVVAIGGLLVGTFLTLVYVPLFYFLFSKISFSHSLREGQMVQPRR